MSPSLADCLGWGSGYCTRLPDGGATAAGIGSPGSLACGSGILIEADTSKRQATAAVTMIKIGGTKMAGCTRMAAAPFRQVVRILSTTTAPATPAADSRGPCPMRPLLRARRSAACRCCAVSPGSR